MGEGVVTYAWKHNVVRMAVDPGGYYNDGKAELEGLAPFVGLGGDGAPGVGASWKALGKDITHWDMWSTNPAEALGRSLIDVGSMFVPGGAAGKVNKVTDALDHLADAERVAEVAGAVPRAIPELPSPMEGGAPVGRGEPPTPHPGGKPPTDTPVVPKPGAPMTAPHDRPVAGSPTETRAPGAPARPESVEAPGVPAARGPDGQGASAGSVGEVTDPSKRIIPPDLVGEISTPSGDRVPLLTGDATAAAPHVPIVAEGDGVSKLDRGPDEPYSAADKADDRVLAGVGARDAEGASHRAPASAGASEAARMPEGPGTGGGGSDGYDRGGPDGASEVHGDSHEGDGLQSPPDESELNPGYYPPGSLPSPQELRGLTASDPDKAYYWSGRDASGEGVGPDGSGVAERMATDADATTLEMTLEKNGLNPLPVWNDLDPESVRFWEDASAAYADNASGAVTAIVGSNLRPGNIWQTVEIPRLMENPNVTMITQIDPETGTATVIFRR